VEYLHSKPIKSGELDKNVLLEVAANNEGSKSQDLEGNIKPSNLEVKTSEFRKDENVTLEEDLKISSKMRRDKKRRKDEHFPEVVKKRKAEVEEEVEEDKAPKKRKNSPLLLDKISDSFEKLTETSLEETLKCLEDLLESETFTEATKLCVEEKEVGKKKESFESKNGHIQDNSSVTKKKVGKKKGSAENIKSCDELSISSISSLVANNNGKENEDLSGTKSVCASDDEPQGEKHGNVEKSSKDKIYESKLENHLNNLREPSPVHKPVRSEKRVEMEEATVPEPVILPVLSEYSIKQEPEEIEIDGTPTVGQLNYNDYNIKQEVVDDSYAFSSDVMVSNFRVDEYNIKKEALEDDQLIGVGANYQGESVLNPYHDWLADHGNKDELAVKLESTEAQGSGSFRNKFAPLEDLSDDEVMVIDTVVNTSDVCAVLDKVIRCEECFKSFQSEQQLQEHLVTHGKPSVEQFAAQQVSKEKFEEINSSAFPKINLVRVSMKNHGYIQSKQLLDIEIGSSNLASIPSPILPSVCKKSESLAKVTTLQALDDLLAPTKKSNTKQGVKIKSTVNDVKNPAQTASKQHFLKEIDKVFEMSSKLSLSQSPTQVSTPLKSLNSNECKKENGFVIQKSQQSVKNKKSSHRFEEAGARGQTPLLGKVNEKPIKARESVSQEQPKKSLPAAFTCQVCLKVNFNTMEALRKHLSYHPHSLCKGKVNICYICDEKFDLEDMSYNVHLVRHLQKMKSSSNMKCLGCYSTFEGKDKLLSHVLSVHEKRKSFPCPVCPKCFDRKRQLLLHITTIHEATSRDIIEKATPPPYHHYS